MVRFGCPLALLVAQSVLQERHQIDNTSQCTRRLLLSFVNTTQCFTISRRLNKGFHLYCTTALSDRDGQLRSSYCLQVIE